MVRVLAALAIGAMAAGFFYASSWAGPLPAGTGAGDRSLRFRNAAEVQTLTSKVQRNGSLRVIVRLDTGFVPEGELKSYLSVWMQRNRISQAQEAVMKRLQAATAQTIYRFSHIPYLALEVDAQGLATLLADPAIVSIKEDVPSSVSLAESVPLIGADAAWASGFAGAGLAVAILDTGVDGSHPFLAGKVGAEGCFSTTSAAYSSTTLCPNGLDEQLGGGAAINCGITGCEHGTHVAGIAAGKGDTFSGVARDATILAAQVFSRFEGAQCTDLALSSPCILSFTSDQIRALEWVYGQQSTFNIAAVNMSIGSGQYTGSCDSDPRKAIIDTLRSVGIATIVSSGNSGYVDAIGAPACISSAISVGSTTKSDVVSSFSNVSTVLDLFAPGSSILSSVPGGTYEAWSGTSMAAPHVTGAWAVLKSEQPGASVDAILAALTSTGMLIGDGRSGGSVSKPRIQVDAALLALLPPTATATVSSTATVTSTTSPIPTPTPTFTDTPLPTATPTPTTTLAASATPSATSTAVVSPTPSPQPTQTPVPQGGSTQWYLAEGYTGQGFGTYILIQNPNVGAATVEVTYMLQGGGVVSRQHVVEGQSRYTIVAGDAGEVGPDAAFSTKVVSDVPVIVERAMYFGNGGHNTIGVTAPALEWYLAEGYTGQGFGTYILIQNPNAGAATVEVTYMLQGGGVVSRQHVVEGQSRYTIVAGDAGEVGPDAAFSTKVVSDVPVIVERAMYFGNGGHDTIAVR